ncbi:ABC transporter substrate-binding protein [Oryzomonas japonica]|uniref:ABC transporter substrate-binding protein n=1 Tax=Oryzomonas japonica TaxID=2603858 RepID=A0A7J4ZN15_9BACT|nr:substrate-binding domain-containing protein [Oryzomonas japonica]KAB0664058.1 ABC transporter substrate-binding protein [Oryzomonas japonica]
MQWIKTLISCLCFLVASGAGAHTCPAGETIRVNGSGSCLDMMKPLVQAYGKIDHDVRIEMAPPLGSSGAIKALLAGSLDLAVSARPLKPEEAAKGARATPYGRTPLAIVAEKECPVTTITTRELEQIYAGKTYRWRNGEAIRLVLRPREDIDTRIMRTLSPGMESAMSAALARPGMLVAVTDADAYQTVVKTPGALGVTGLTSVLVNRLPLVALSLNGVKPSPRTVASGTYPLAKEINFVTRPDPPPAVRRFLNFVHSPQGRAIAKKAGVLVTARPAAYE